MALQVLLQKPRPFKGKYKMKQVNRKRKLPDACQHFIAQSRQFFINEEQEKELHSGQERQYADPVGEIVKEK